MPPIELANPHCGLIASWLIGAYFAASVPAIGIKKLPQALKSGKATIAAIGIGAAVGAYHKYNVGAGNSNKIISTGTAVGTLIG